MLVVGVPDPEVFLRAFRKGLRDAAYNERENVQLDIRSAEGKPERLPELAAELVRRNVAVIVGFQTPAVEAAKQATTEIPIVMDAGEPVGMGLVANLARPGGNVTGMSARTAELAPKNLEFCNRYSHHSGGSRCSLTRPIRSENRSWNSPSLMIGIDAKSLRRSSIGCAPES